VATTEATAANDASGPFDDATKRLVPTAHSAERERPWKPLLLYSAYRQTLALIFVVLFFTDFGPSLLGSYDRALFTNTSLAYLVLAIIGTLLVLRRLPPFSIQVAMVTLIDITALTLLTHASGGLPSGLGTLLAIVVAAGAVLMVGELALLLAAIASLALLSEQVYSHWLGLFGDTHYTQAGIHGTVFFATALVAQWLAGHLRETEAIAAQRGVDLANLAQLNDYIIRRMQSGIVVVDAGNRVRLMNASAHTLLGLKEEHEATHLDAISRELSARLTAWRNDPTTEIGTLRSADDATDVIPRFARLGAGSDSGTLVFLEDSSSMDRQVQQMKQASLGRLTGSIAHEIRNPLGAISHAAQLLDESPAISTEDERLVEIIRQHSQRVNEIIESVLQLSRRSLSQPEALRLKPWLMRLIEDFCRDESHAPESIRVDIDPPDIQIHFDPVQLRQIVVNLVGNALHHGHRPNGDGQATEPVMLRGGSAAGIRGPFLEVVDHGPGIDAENVRHIFEPFFTTDSRGSGLGLYIARALCEHNYARLDYLSPPGGGSCFRIRFADLPLPENA